MGKKLKYFVLGALCLLGLVTGGNAGQPVKAADAATMQEVVLTKFGFDSKNMVQDAGAHSTADTLEKAQEGWAKDATALPGVEFEIKDVTKEYWAAFDSTHDEATLYNEALKMKGTEVKADNGEPYKTDDKGQIRLSLNKTSDGQRAVYLFTETSGAAGHYANATFVLDMGTQAAEDGVIYVYPKNAKVVTHFHKFTKVDKETQKPLEGAKFQIKNSDGKYAALTEGETKTPVDEKALQGYVDASAKGYDIDWVDQKDASTFTSDASGEFGLGGMDTFSTTGYFAEETEAPKGYDTAADTEFGFDDFKGKKPIEDKPEGFLPHTGGAGIIGIIAAGIVLILATVFGIRKRQAQA